MRRKVTAVWLGLIAAVLCSAVTPSRADAEACTLWSTGLHFMRPYDFLQKTADTTIGTIGYTCSGENKNAEVRVDISGGNSGSPLDRYMVNGSARLFYNVYYLGNYSWIWGDGAQGVDYEKMMDPDASGKFIDTATFLAAIAPGQNVKTGLYDDTLVATLTVEH